MELGQGRTTLQGGGEPAKAATVSSTPVRGWRWRCSGLPERLLTCLPVFFSGSHAVGAVVLLGSSQHAVPLVRLLLDVLEEVRRPEDAQQGRRPRGEDLAQPCQQCKLRQETLDHSSCLILFFLWALCLTANHLLPCFYEL